MLWSEVDAFLETRVIMVEIQTKKTRKLCSD